MLYKVNEIFESVQGEGIYTGRHCAFIRLSGCNRSCPFCDTTHENFTAMSPDEIARLINLRSVVITGGEPFLQPLEPLIAHLMKRPIHITIETNGSLPVPEDIERTCIISLSPKNTRSRIYPKSAHSLKILYPYILDKISDEYITAQSFLDFGAPYKSLQIISPELNTRHIIKQAIEELKTLPSDWRLGIQIHKFIGLK